MLWVVLPRGIVITGVPEIFCYNSVSVYQKELLADNILPLLIIMVWQSHLFGKVRAIVPVARSRFDFAWLHRTYWNNACQGRSRSSGALAAFTSIAPVSNLLKQNQQLWLALIFRNGGSQNPVRWLKALRYNHTATSLYFFVKVRTSRHIR